MADTFKPDTQSPFGFDLESAIEAKTRLKKERASVFANSPNGFFSLGAALASIGTAANNRLKGRIDPAVKMAQSNDEAMKAYNDTLMQGLTGGTPDNPIDQDKAERKALAAAVASFRMNGNEEAASRTLNQLLNKQREAELFELSKAKLQAQAGGTEKKEWERQDAVRKEVDDKLKDDVKSFTSLDNLESALSQGTAQADVAAIFAYMKVLDPQSTVREGEFATVAAAKEFIANQLTDGSATLSKRVVEEFLNKLSGERFTDRQRVEMANAARAAMRPRAGRVAAEVTDAVNLATSRKWDPDVILSGGTKDLYDRFKATDMLSDIDKGLVDQGYSIQQLLDRSGKPLGPPANAPRQTPQTGGYTPPQVAPGSPQAADQVVGDILNRVGWE